MVEVPRWATSIVSALLMISPVLSNRRTADRPERGRPGDHGLGARDRSSTRAVLRRQAVLVPPRPRREVGASRARRRTCSFHATGRRRVQAVAPALARKQWRESAVLGTRAGWRL